MPPGLVRPAPVPSRLERWKRTEPVRLYTASVFAAVFLVLVAVGLISEDLSAALTGLVAAVLVAVPTASFARASVYSPATEAARRDADADRWAAAIRSGQMVP